MTKKEGGGWEDEGEEVPSNWITWGVPVEDKVLGTLISKRTMKSTFPGKEGELVNIYEMKVDEGTFHTVDDKKNPVQPAVIIESGEIYNIGGKAMIDRQMKNIKVGQKIGMKFIEEVASKTKGFAAAKVVKVYTFKNDDGTVKMDEAFLAEINQSELAAEFEKK